MTLDAQLDTKTTMETAFEQTMSQMDTLTNAQRQKDAFAYHYGISQLLTNFHEHYTGTAGYVSFHDKLQKHASTLREKFNKQYAGVRRHGA